MPFNVSTFKASLADWGYLKANHFDVIVTPPPILTGKSFNYGGASTPVSEIARELKFRVQQARLPGIDLQTVDYARYGLGLTQKHPLNTAMKDSSFIMLSDGYGDIYQFWYNWCRSISDFNGVQNTNNTEIPAMYTMEYRDNYASIITLCVYDILGNLILKYNFNEAFPICLNETPLAWENNNNLLAINVIFSYKSFNLEGASF